MPKLSITNPRRWNPLSLLALLLVVGGVGSMLRGRGPDVSMPAEADYACDPVLDPMCAVASDEQLSARRASGLALPGDPPGPVLGEGEACHNVGYLCAGLEMTGSVQIRRWTPVERPIVIHVPIPEFEDRASARRLQMAAAAGIRIWNDIPFPVIVDQRGDRAPDFAVVWTQDLPGSQIGVASTRWSRQRGLEVVEIRLRTQSPYGRGVIDPNQVRLTAAHEMGHALGLPHSDSRRDVMYPTNAALTVSARDYKTMEALYRLKDGTEIVR